jgi:hypothetical protein
MPPLDTIALTDDQRSAIASATAALLPPDRDLFLAALAAKLEGEAELGDGNIARAIRGLLTTRSYRCVELSPTPFGAGVRRPSKLLGAPIR